MRRRRFIAAAPDSAPRFMSHRFFLLSRAFLSLILIWYYEPDKRCRGINFRLNDLISATSVAAGATDRWRIKKLAYWDDRRQVAVFFSIRLAGGGIRYAMRFASTPLDSHIDCSILEIRVVCVHKRLAIGMQAEAGERRRRVGRGDCVRQLFTAGGNKAISSNENVFTAAATPSRLQIIKNIVAPVPAGRQFPDIIYFKW